MMTHIRLVPHLWILNFTDSHSVLICCHQQKRPHWGPDSGPDGTMLVYGFTRIITWDIFMGFIYQTM